MTWGHLEVGRGHNGRNSVGKEEKDCLCRTGHQNFRSHSRLRHLSTAVNGQESKTQQLLSACRGCANCLVGKARVCRGKHGLLRPHPAQPRGVDSRYLPRCLANRRSGRPFLSLHASCLPRHLDYLAPPTSTSRLDLQTTAGLLQAPKVASQRAVDVVDVVDVVVCGLVRQSRISTVRKLGFSFKRVLLTRVCES